MIRIQSVSKQFRLYRRPSDRIWEWVARRPRHRAFWALRDISLDIPSGRTMGIVGPNGAGKSTLLKLVTGTLVPTSGTIEVEGRVAALLELGTGFHPEFTGRQNIWINGQLLGLSAEEIGRREQEIIDFSELGPFIDQPIRTYSSGMVVRLGFSVAASVDPDVLIVDEALSVGDAHFSQKCIRRIREFRGKGTTILFVSHDVGAVVSLCDEAVLLNAGEILARGQPEAILEEYTALLARRGENNVEMTVKFVDPAEGGDRPSHRAGTFQALVSAVRWLSAAGHPTKDLISGERTVLEIEVVFLAPIRNPTIGFLIRDRLGQDVFGTNTHRMGMSLGDFQAGERLVMRSTMDLTLGAGDYSLTTAVHRDETHLEECFDWTDRHYLFRVSPDRRDDFYGVSRLRPDVETRRDTVDADEVSRALALVFPDLPEAYTPDGAILPSPFLQGFHSIERDGEGQSFRWTTEEAFFVAPATGRELALTVAAWGHPGGANGSGEVTLSLDFVDQPLGDRTLAAGEQGEVTWTLPHRKESKVGRIGLFRLRVHPCVEEGSQAGAAGTVGSGGVSGSGGKSGTGGSSGSRKRAPRRLGVAVSNVAVR